MTPLGLPLLCVGIRCERSGGRLVVIDLVEAEPEVPVGFQEPELLSSMASMHLC